MADSLLTPAQKSRYEADVIGVHTAGAQRSERPTAVILAGQPGSGKGGLAQLNKKRFASQGGSVLVDADEARAMHPKYVELSRANDKTAASLTHPDASAAVTALQTHAIKNGYNLVIDGTLKSPANALNLVKQLKDAGYRVEVVAMCTSPDKSWAGVQERYERGRKEKGFGRWVPKELHDAAATGIVQSLIAVNNQGLISTLQIANRAGQTLVSCTPSDSVVSAISSVYASAAAESSPGSASASGVPAVSMGAMLACSFGVAPSSLTVLPVRGVLCEGAPQANIMDFAPMVNIMPFGMCMSMANPEVAAATAAAMGVLTPMPCIPATSAPWMPGAPTVLLGGQPALDSTCTCMCMWAGVISITMPATVKTMVP